MGALYLAPTFFFETHVWYGLDLYIVVHNVLFYVEIGTTCCAEKYYFPLDKVVFWVYNVCRLKRGGHERNGW